VNRVHTSGEVLEEQHTGEGTRLVARVGAQLAADLGAAPVH
jgi:GTPase